jgi:nitrate reductase gamma subunit
MKEFILELLSNDYFVLGAMSIIICLITQLLKMPIKLFTNKIKNSKTEDRVTALLMLLPLVLGVLFNFLYNVYYLKIAFSVIEGLSWGTASIMFYKGFKKLVTGKEPTAEESEKIKSVKDLVQKIASDGKVDKTDTTAINEYLNKVK